MNTTKHRLLTNYQAGRELIEHCQCQSTVRFHLRHARAKTELPLNTHLHTLSLKWLVGLGAKAAAVFQFAKWGNLSLKMLKIISMGFWGFGVAHYCYNSNSD